MSDPRSNIVVMKFGGTSVEDAIAIQRTVSIVAGRIQRNQSPVVIVSAMAKLTEMTRMVFHLRAQEDLPFREIASLVGTTEQGARWHMHQARTKLLKHLAKES